MTDRERLIDRIINTPKKEYLVVGGRLNGKKYRTAEMIADHILSDGWIRPPCKVGDTVYIVNTDIDGEVFMEENKIYDVSTTSMFISATMPISDEILCAEPYEDIGKTIFLTREEAEKALAERKLNNE